MSYQNIQEDIYEICRRRKLKLDELALAIYLRGKSLRFGNPFYLTHRTIYKELNTSRKIIDKIKDRLQLKGVIKYNPGVGRLYTEYHILDTFESAPKGTLRVRQKDTSYISIIDKRRKKLKLAHCLSNNRMLIRSL